MSEMTDRRRRLIKYMYKKENRLDQFEVSYPDTIKKKDDVIHRFSSLQLEELLNNSTKNVAQEVVTCLIPKKGEGVLVMIEQQHEDVLVRKPSNQRDDQNNNSQSFDNSQVIPQPKTSNNLPQPQPMGPTVAQAQKAVRRDRASRSPNKDRHHPSEGTRPQFVAPHEY